MRDKSTGKNNSVKQYKKRFQPIFKGMLLKCFELYSRENEITKSALIQDAVREKLIRENAYPLDRFRGIKGTG